MPISPKHAEVLLQQLQVLVVDDNAFMRTVVRGLLNNIGVKGVIEAGDGIAALDKIREETPTSSSSTGKCRCSMGQSWCGSCAHPAYSRRRTFLSSCSARTVNKGVFSNR